MGKILKGYAYDLEKLIRIEGYHGFLLESGSSDHEGDQKIYDLGRRRLLKICREEVSLMLVGSDRIVTLELKGGCNISDVLRKKGYKCSIIADYGGRMGKDGKTHGFYWQTWKMATNKREAVFSENGYALQYKGWLDYTFYQFELNIMKKGWITIDGYDIAAFRFWNVTVDVMDRAIELVEKALEGARRISGKELGNLLSEHGLKDETEYLYMDEREE